jgi:hypothetical protein
MRKPHGTSSHRLCVPVDRRRTRGWTDNSLRPPRARDFSHMSGNGLFLDFVGVWLMKPARRQFAPTDGASRAETVRRHQAGDAVPLVELKVLVG